MRLFNCHDLEDMDFAPGVMDGIESGEGSPDMEAEISIVSFDGQPFLVGTAARVWVASEAEQVISDDGLGSSPGDDHRSPEPVFCRGGAGRSRGKLHEVTLHLDCGHLHQKTAFLLMNDYFGEESVIGLPRFIHIRKGGPD